MLHLFTRGLARLVRVNCCRGTFYTMASKKTLSTVTAVELSIDVPWGRISGKAWGSPSGRPVLSLHGWLDNAGSFDKLIPLLSPDLYVVAIDWPGHGMSSPRPAGSYYHMINYVADLRHVIDGLGWKKFSFLSHSMGAGVATLFAASLPEYVEKMVALEGLLPMSVDTMELPTKMGNSLRNLGKFEDKATKVYPTQDACVARLMEGNKDLTQESAETLCIRGIAPVENGQLSIGYVFTRDLRLKTTSLLYFSSETLLSFLKAVKCPVLIISAEKSFFPKEKVDALIKFLKVSKWVVVPGNHHVHLNNAATVAPIVNEWLTTDIGVN